MRGLLRVTLPPFLATCLLMSDLGDFARVHPGIEMQIVWIRGPLRRLACRTDALDYCGLLV